MRNLSVKYKLHEFFSRDAQFFSILGGQEEIYIKSKARGF